MNLGSVINIAKLGRRIETNCVLKNTPPPLFWLEVVYKVGGVLTGHYGIHALTCSLLHFIVYITWIYRSQLGARLWLHSPLALNQLFLALNQLLPPLALNQLFPEQ